MQSSYHLFIFISITVFCSIGFLRLSNAAPEAEPTRFLKTITVKATGGGDYKTIGDAIAKGVPEDNTKWIRIIVFSGTYTEKVVIPRNKPFIFMDGQSWGKTVIAHNGNTNLQDSAIQVAADNFVVRHMTFKNTYNTMVLQKNGNPRVQAVAAFIQGDKNSFYECSFIGVQDTLWDALGRHYFRNCYIEGSVDFIFGNGQSVYEKCTINVTGSGFITAHGRETATEPTGFVFKYCTVTGSGPTNLGRAWGPFSRVLYYKTLLANIITPEGWNAWYFKGKEKNLVYAEEGCTGPGADTSKRVPWRKKLSSTELSFFTGSSFNNQDHWIENQPIRRS
ncbi:Pectinesterase qrt1 [Thalictrum thalictroides]|uniref:Pectinesterase n=1 Tax=Thalictrum thalictroides TaxID=46969 RepID=A0A7J6V200_THATH|nr:Pectinesterase qrt1 [Thalictrum thalictroides]